MHMSIVLVAKLMVIHPHLVPLHVVVVTVFPAVDKFNVEVGALILQPEWSQMLASECRGGCVAITTN